MAFKPLRLSDEMPFGENKGEEIEDLIYDNPSYLAWLFEEEIVTFDDEVIKKLEEKKVI